MLTLTTNTGKIIECDAIVRGTMFDVLHIHTHSITPAEAYTIFGDINETSVLIKKEIDEITNSESIIIYKGFTEFYSIQKSPFIEKPNCYMIWLNRPVQLEEIETNIESDYTEEEIQEGRDAIELLNIIFGNE